MNDLEWYEVVFIRDLLAGRVNTYVLRGCDCASCKEESMCLENLKNREIINNDLKLNEKYRERYERELALYILAV